MLIKRSRSNAKANIWDIEISTSNAVNFIFTVQRSKYKYENEECIGDELILENSRNNNIRRNAIPNIWLFSFEIGL